MYLKAYESGSQVRAGLRDYFEFYNAQRPHQALGYKTPAEVYAGDVAQAGPAEATRTSAEVLSGYSATAGLKFDLASNLSN